MQNNKLLVTVEAKEGIINIFNIMISIPNFLTNFKVTYKSFIISMIIKGLLYIIFSVILSSCIANSDLDSALDLAGGNRAEIEKVLKHYRYDSLKLEAAKFLITNMPIYYSYIDESVENFKYSFVNAIETGHVGKEALDKTKNTVGFPILNNHTIAKDIEVIKSEYLIENIDHSFMVWQEQPWGKYISFDDFCEYILPYRIENEAIENWKSKYYNRYQPILDSLLTNDNILDACKIIYNHIINDSWSFILEMPEPHLGAEFLLDNRAGSCRDRCDLAIYVMRSLGIPVGTDMVLQSPDQANRHFWSFVIDNDGNTVEFTLWDEAPGDNYNAAIEKKRGKVYRNDFSYKKEKLRLKHRVNMVPGLLSKMNLRDVSDQYFNKNEIIFNEKELDNISNEVIYLCVFDINGWIPISWGEISKNKLSLKNIEDNVLYSLCFFEDEMSTPIYYPFYINKNNSKVYFNPSLEKQSISIERKYTMKFMQEHMKRFKDGIFEASNDSNFTTSEIIYIIDSISHPKYYAIDVNLNAPYRYYRYMSPDNSLCNMAELIFFDKNEREVVGEVIGSDGAIFNEERLNKYSVFDNDVLTFFNAPDITGMWVGMDFHYPKEISKIMFLPRNDDNFIRNGEKYELYYAEKYGWKSLGIRTGTDSQKLIYENVPKNALFWLRNLTKGKEERPFSYEDNNQKWW